MDPVTLYLLLALVQGQGPVAFAFGTQPDCIEDRLKVIRETAPLAISECLTVVLKPVEVAKP